MQLGTSIRDAHSNLVFIHFSLSSSSYLTCPSLSLRCSKMTLRLSNSPCMQWRADQRPPDHVTTTDFQSALPEDHHRPALRMALSEYSSLKELS